MFDNWLCYFYFYSIKIRILIFTIFCYYVLKLGFSFYVPICNISSSFLVPLALMFSLFFFNTLFVSCFSCFVLLFLYQRVLRTFRNDFLFQYSYHEFQFLVFLWSWFIFLTTCNVFVNFVCRCCSLAFWRYYQGNYLHSYDSTHLIFSFPYVCITSGIDIFYPNLCQLLESVFLLVPYWLICFIYLAICYFPLVLSRLLMRNECFLSMPSPLVFIDDLL